MFDGEYRMGSVDWVADYGRRFSAFLFNNNIAPMEYRTDCDDYALMGAAMARIDHSRYCGDAAGLAWGVAYFWTDTEGHATNIGVHRSTTEPTSSPGDLAVKLWEPQPRNGICMTEFDISSVRLWRLVLF